MGGFAIVLSFLALGLVLQRLARLPAATAGWLTRYVIYVAVPAMVLLHLPRLTLDTSIWVPMVTPWVMMAVCMLLIVAAARCFAWPREVMGALLIVVPLGNTSFLGFPIVESFYGSDGLAYAVLYDQFGSFIGLALVATTLAALFAKRSDDSIRLTAPGLLLKVLTFPPFIALLLALLILFTNTPYPEWLATALQYLAMTLVPVVMVAVGLQLKLKVPREDLTPFAFSLLLKLLVLPAIAFMGFYYAGLSGLAVKVSILEAAMPPMITAGAIAMAAGIRPGLVAAIIGYGVLGSVLTLPLWYWVIEGVF